MALVQAFSLRRRWIFAGIASNSGKKTDEVALDAAFAKQMMTPLSAGLSKNTFRFSKNRCQNRPDAV
ncbi:MAG: hypothetical protein J5998_00440 [Clostridia bacterium]|nr:hypothetical protein [Clostridia bacterium]